MSDLSDFDDAFEPRDTSFAKADELPDGDYVFLIKDTSKKTVNGDTVIEWKLEVLTDCPKKGLVITESHWINSQEAAERYGKTLQRLGFDSENWKKANDRPFSKECIRSLDVLVGMRIKTKKVTNVGKKKYDTDTPRTYHNINVLGRTSDEDARPRKIGPKEMDEINVEAKKAADYDPFA